MSMRALLLLGLLLSSGCVLRALSIGGPEARGIRVRDRDTGRVTVYGLPYEAPLPRTSPQLAEPGPLPIAQHRRTGKLSTRVVFSGGHIKLIALPHRSSSELVFAFRPIAPLLPGECELRAYRDGAPLSVGDHVRRSDHELLATLRLDELGPSERFAGSACGRSFELDRAGRDTIVNFVARVRERLDAQATEPGHLARTVDQVTHRHEPVAR
jgi:hypothetical protein